MEPRRDKIEVVSTLDTLFGHKQLDVLLGYSDVQDALVVVENNDTQRPSSGATTRLAYVLARAASHCGRSRTGSWSSGSTSAVPLRAPPAPGVLRHPMALHHLEGVQVEDGAETLLYRDGVLVDRLSPGLHVFWKGTGKVAWKTVDRREQVADVAGQEIITSDKVSLRVNLVVAWQVADAVQAVTASADHAQALYREAQLALRAAVGTRTLDVLLADKESVGGEVLEALTLRVKGLGVVVRSVGLRDVILPGEMKAPAKGVIAAKRRRGQLIKRREETA